MEPPLTAFALRVCDLGIRYNFKAYTLYPKASRAPVAGYDSQLRADTVRRSLNGAHFSPLQRAGSGTSDASGDLVHRENSDLSPIDRCVEVLVLFSALRSDRRVDQAIGIFDGRADQIDR